MANNNRPLYVPMWMREEEQKQEPPAPGRVVIDLVSSSESSEPEVKTPKKRGKGRPPKESPAGRHGDEAGEVTRVQSQGRAQEHGGFVTKRADTSAASPRAARQPHKTHHENAPTAQGWPNVSANERASIATKAPESLERGLGFSTRPKTSTPLHPPTPITGRPQFMTRTPADVKNEQPLLSYREVLDEMADRKGKGKAPAGEQQEEQTAQPPQADITAADASSDQLTAPATAESLRLEAERERKAKRAKYNREYKKRKRDEEKAEVKKADEKAAEVAKQDSKAFATSMSASSSSGQTSGTSSGPPSFYDRGDPPVTPNIPGFADTTSSIVGGALGGLSGRAEQGNFDAFRPHTPLGYGAGSSQAGPSSNTAFRTNFNNGTPMQNPMTQAAGAQPKPTGSPRTPSLSPVKVARPKWDGPRSNSSAPNSPALLAAPSPGIIRTLSPGVGEPRQEVSPVDTEGSPAKNPFRQPNTPDKVKRPALTASPAQASAQVSNSNPAPNPFRTSKQDKGKGPALTVDTNAAQASARSPIPSPAAAPYASPYAATAPPILIDLANAHPAVQAVARGVFLPNEEFPNWHTVHPTSPYPSFFPFHGPGGPVYSEDFMAVMSNQPASEYAFREPGHSIDGLAGFFGLTLQLTRIGWRVPVRPEHFDLDLMNDDLRYEGKEAHYMIDRDVNSGRVWCSLITYRGHPPF